MRVILSRKSNFHIPIWLRVIAVLLLVSAMLPIGNVWASQLFQAGPDEVDVVIQAAPSPSYIEQTVTFIVTVELKGTDVPVTSGALELRSGDEKVCDLILNSSGQGSCDLIFDTPALVPLQAFYLGVNQILPGASALYLHTVMDKHHPQVEVTQDDPDPSIIDRTIFTNASVTSAGPIPSGQLIFYRSDATCLVPDATSAIDTCTSALDGSGEGQCSLTLSEQGNIFICAAYQGDYAHYAAVSASEPHRVSNSNTFTTITSISPEPSLAGQLLTVNFSVTSPDGQPSSGLVTVIGPDGNCSATAAEGSCQLTIYQPHLQPVYASYAGETDGNPIMQTGVLEPKVELQASVSDVVMHRVNVPPTDILADPVRINAFLGANTRVATLTAVDANLDESHSFVLVDGVGADNNNLFWIDGDRLVAFGSLPLDPGYLNIRVMAIDPAGLTFEKVLTLWVNNNTPLLPDTGFAAGKTTPLKAQESPYRQQAGVTLSITRLGITIPITGVPIGDQGWLTDWLANEAGWLDGTAFPGWEGNSVLAGHNYLADGSAGPFKDLQQLRWGDRIEVTAFGSTSVFEVRAVKKVKPDDLSILEHQDQPYLTLVTCKSFSEKTQRYQWRVVVEAVLISVK